MKKRYAWMLAGALAGAAAALIQSFTGAQVMEALLHPFTLFGNLLRGWSLSGAAGNAAAWAVLIALSLLPVIYILLARRKRKQAGDWLFLLTGAIIFGGLFLLINPTLYVHPALTEALHYAPELLTGGPVFMMLSALLLSVVVRWSGGLMGMKKAESRLIFWTQAILTFSMTLIVFSSAYSLTDGLRAAFFPGGNTVSANLFAAESVSGMGADASSDALSAWMNSQYSDNSPLAAMSSPASRETSALIGLILTAITLIPNIFSVCMLDAASSLVSSIGRGFFSEETDGCASVLAVRARYTMIASVGSMAAENALTVLLAQWIANWNMSFSLPLDDLLLSCGAMLLARLLSAACKVKRDNDLMI
ncbi:MAG: hypothetical protein IJE08_03775 [Clostridia bacterium]|nr:hypothetical protein [Clostridia bacterium]